MGTAERGRGDFRQAKVLDLALSAILLEFVVGVSEAGRRNNRLQRKYLLL